VKKHIPQWVVWIWCAAGGHKQERYSAWDKGVQVIVYTCRCGSKQRSHVLPANRKIRRSL
jgi:lysyl-tRNA synthetase class I